MKLFITSLIAAIASANSNADDTTGIFGNDELWKTGTVKIDKVGDDIFYWMFQSRQETASTDPLVLWLTGGPGCASEVALFYENGPFGFNTDGTLRSNPHSWNEISNLLFVD
jgi:cathepsin A (carboxypeptidase C)